MALGCLESRKKNQVQTLYPKPSWKRCDEIFVVFGTIVVLVHTPN